MNHLFIIFSENGKLHTHCEKLINSTQYRNILEEVRMCFLNGKQSHSPVSGDDSLEESGILLVYDAHNDPAYDKERLASALQKISTKYKHLYVCYHARSAEGWEDKISELDLKWAKKAITKSHTEEPYSFLHEFHSGLKTIEDLIAFLAQRRRKTVQRKQMYIQKQLVLGNWRSKIPSK